MYDIKINAKQNSMLISIDGRMEMDEAHAYTAKYRQCIDRMAPGFSVIVDLTNFIATAEDVRLVVQQANTYAVEHGLGRVIRIVPDSVNSKIGNIQCNRQARELGYQAEVVGSMEEARATLGID